MTLGRRVVLVAAVFAAGAVAAVTPGLRAPLARLANYEADSPLPQYDVPVDDAALRRAAAILPDRTGVRYFVRAPVAEPVQYGNVHAAMRLYALPALPVRDLGKASWIVDYAASPPLPAGMRLLRAYRLGAKVVLVQVAT